jgi:Na+-driven multidrug efflux pump
MITGAVFLVVGLLGMKPYARAMSADPNTARLAVRYLSVFVPAMALQFALVAMGSALRAVGNFKPGMFVSTTTVIINMVLAPFLIFGWGTGRPFGVAGAAMSSLIAIIIGVVWLAMYFIEKDAYLRFVVADWGPRIEIWKRILAIGLPAGFEFGVTALYLVIVYAIMRPFGAPAQAGFGIGMRVIQASFMPVVASVSQ